ncbi:MAG TPA: hypothetical protein VKU41_29535 [Polyangiaceae bacterium]|nr:hypothetical protein [Polyangiaceae bacterium]
MNATEVPRLAIAASLFLVSAAQAQEGTAPAPGSEGSDSTAAAQALFVEGRALVRDGRYAEGCEKLEQSRRLDPAPGTEINLADCFEKMGLLASAWLAFREAAATAQRFGRAQWAEKALERAHALEAVVPHMTVTVDDPAPGTVVRRGGIRVDESTLGSPVPVNPGAYVVDAFAPRRRPWSTRVVVEAATHVVLHVPPLVEETADVKPVTAAEPRRAAAARGSLQRTIAVGLLALSAVPVGMGAYFGLSAISHNHSAAALCPTSPACTNPDAVRLTDEARQDAVASNVAFIAGGVLLAAAAGLFVTAPAKPRGPSVAIAVEGTTASLRASW